MPKVDQDMCIGCGLCVGSCPEVFEFNDDGKAEAIEGATAANVADVADNCPVGAIMED